MDDAGAAPRGHSHETVLAAVRRATLHTAPGGEGATLRAVREHLALTPRGAASRALPGTLRALERGGALRRRRMRGEDAWQLTPAGEQALLAARRARRAPALPESPQHRAWREAREAAGRELPRLASELGTELASARRMLAALDGVAPAPSDAWLALGPRLLAACRRLGSAWHCLHEWPEPRDERPQQHGPRPRDPLPADEAAVLRAGRRNAGLWARRADPS